MASIFYAFLSELHLVSPFEVFHVLFLMFSPLELVPDVDVVMWGTNALFVCALALVKFPPHTAVHYNCWLIFSLLL